MDKPGFRITSKKGFHVTFANGWTVSVQFGPGNYCENYYRSIGSEEEASGSDGSGTAEVAAWSRGDEWLRFDGDTVQGHVTPDDVLALMVRVAAMPAE